MQNTESRILAVNPGSRYTGYAVFLDTEPYDWGIKTLKGHSFNERQIKFESFLSDMVDTYEINSLALKSLHPARSSLHLSRMSMSLRACAKRNGLRVRRYSVKEIEVSTSGPGALNKAKLMEAVATSYPFLYPDLFSERERRNPYLVRMFEAVALAMKFLGDSDALKGRKD